MFDNIVTSYSAGSQSKTLLYINLQNFIILLYLENKAESDKHLYNLLVLSLLILSLNTFTRVRLCGYFVCHTVETVSSSVQLNIVTATVMKQQSACCLRVKQTNTEAVGR